MKPEDTFKHYYGILSGDERVIDKKLDLGEEADRRHRAGEKIRFSETKFFADEIIERYLSKPKTQQ